MPINDFYTAGRSRLESMAHPETFYRLLRILVVDDEPTIREFVGGALRDDGHFVETAVDGLDGLERFRRGAWDLVLTDRAMPGLSGERLAAEIKIVAPYLPIVMISGFAPTITDAHDQLNSVDLLVRKPFRLDTLRQAVQKAMNMYAGPIDGEVGVIEGEERAIG